MTNKTKGDFNGMQKENARIEDKWTNFLFYIFVTMDNTKDNIYSPIIFIPLYQI